MDDLHYVSFPLHPQPYSIIVSKAQTLRERIVRVYSPVLAEKKLLEGIGKKLKKNNVALDIVSFGEEDGDKGEKLEALLNAVNSNDNSHIVHIHGGERILSDVLIRSLSLHKTFHSVGFSF